MHGRFRKNVFAYRNAWSGDNDWSGDKTRNSSQTRRKQPQFRKPTDSEQEEIRFRALTNHVKTAVPIRQRKRVLAKLSSGLSYEERHELAALNPYAGELFARNLAGAFYSTPVKSEPHAVTLISDSLNAELYGPWPTLDEARAFVAHALAGLPYLMMIQVGFRRITHREVNGQGYGCYHNRNLICLHAHGIVWGDETAVRYRLRAMDPSLGAQGGDLRPLFDAGGWFTYAAEDPRFIETRRKRNKTRGYWPAVAPIQLNVQARLVHYLFRVDKPGLCVAAGVGKKVLRRAVKRARSRGYTGHGEISIQRQGFPPLPLVSRWEQGAPYDPVLDPYYNP